MIVDVTAFAGAWPSHPVHGRLEDVVDSLKQVGVDCVMCSPLDAVWCRNPHLYNGPLLQACKGRTELLPVPIIDPTLATWAGEIDDAVAAGAKAIRLLPNYHSYGMSEVDALWDAVAANNLVIFVQTRMEDPRRQHPLSVVGDVPVADIVALARKRAGLKVVIGGVRTGEIRSVKEALLDVEGLYADVSQADGLDAIRVLVQDGVSEKLLFGSHAPLFIPHSAVARVVTDIDDGSAEAILGGNAAALFGMV
jgi:predicted TIM-barrel fold metal-dependent hydrolase